MAENRKKFFKVSVGMCIWAMFGVYQQLPEDEWAFPSPSAPGSDDFENIYPKIDQMNTLTSLGECLMLNERILRISRIFLPLPFNSLSFIISSALLIKHKNIEKHNRKCLHMRNLCMRIIRGASSSIASSINHTNGDTSECGVRWQRCISFRVISTSETSATQYRLSYIKKKA